jgi:murein DD-endopeptidase MepM/ murein hydrolase activator NlpD
VSEHGPRKVATRVKWLVSTLLVGFSGVAIVGIAIAMSLRLESPDSVMNALQQARRSKDKPRMMTAGLANEKPAVMGIKTAKVAQSSKGLVTRNLIYEPVTQKRGTRDFVTNKPYVRLVAQLATERADDALAIPPFDPLTLFGSDTPIKKEQAGAELSTDPRVTVRLVEAAGGFLPREDNQALSDSEAEKYVAEADALYAETDTAIVEVPEEVKPDAPPVRLAAERNTTILYKSTEEEASEETYDTRSVVAKGGETLESVIKSQGVDSAQAALAAEAMVNITKVKRLRWGEEVRLALTTSTVEEGSLDVAKLSVFYQNAHLGTIATDNEGDFTVSQTPVTVETASDDNDRSTLYLSTFRAALSQQLPADFVMRFLKIHAYDADFKTRVKSGDAFEVFYDMAGEDSNAEKPNELLYAAFTIGGETRGYYRFKTPDGAVDYYDEKGSNSKKFLMKMPVKLGRLTSTFGYRKHPLTGVLKPHTGIDWSAPIGTPIMASGNGVIEVAGREGGYGNYVRIRHANGYKTAYGHMLRFAEGSVKGAKVRQGQVIGYLGNTGLSTGPHLHYEVIVNNKFTNPLSLKIPRSRQLQGRLLTEFRREKNRIDELMRRAPVKTRVAAIER